MTQSQLLQLFPMTAKIVTKVCLWFAASCVVFVAIITNPFTVLLILGSLPLASLSDCLSILALLSGALGVGLCRKSSATT